MSYHLNVICCVYIYVTLNVCPTQELVDVRAMIKYHLIIVGKIVLAYPTNRSIFSFLICYAGESVIFPFFYVDLSRQQFKGAN